MITVIVAFVVVGAEHLLPLHVFIDNQYNPKSRSSDKLPEAAR